MPKEFEQPNPFEFIKPFIATLYQMVDDPKNKEVVGWYRSGLCFEIRDKHRFTEELLPDYYTHSNFASFHRQLNMYHFQKTNKQGSTTMRFGHPFFKKGDTYRLQWVTKNSDQYFGDRVDFEDKPQAPKSPKPLPKVKWNS